MFSKIGVVLSDLNRDALSGLTYSAGAIGIEALANQTWDLGMCYNWGTFILLAVGLTVARQLIKL